MSGLSADVGNRLNDVKNTFSSWDTCMSKAYCKWPVIVSIVVASVILFTIVWSCAACLCCGVSFCAGCMRCFTCFGCCGACKSRGGSGGSRHKDDYTKMTPSPYNGYQPQPSPMSYQPPSSGPQFAQFDASSRNVHADSLPAMPTWNTSRTTHVEDHSESANGFGNDVEMGRMNTNQTQTRNRGVYNQVPHGPISPMSPPPGGHARLQGPSHPYSSDLGTQRLGTVGMQQVPSPEFQSTPLSPAPTYRTLQSVTGAAATDRFTRGTMSPSPSEYNSRNHVAANRDHIWSPLAESHHEPTDYHYHPSSPSPVEQQSSPYFYPPQEQSGVRPPSLLQIGRKPVAGSHREI